MRLSILHFKHACAHVACYSIIVVVVQKTAP